MRPELHCSGIPEYSFRRTPEEVLHEVKRFRGENDGEIIVSIHWGLEYLDSPAPSQVALGRALIDAGAVFVIGHHSHVLQHVEQYRKGVICYSLGNFIFDLWHERTKPTVIATVSVERGEARIVGLVPARINSDFQPEPVYGPEGDRIVGALERCSQELDELLVNGDEEGYRREYEVLRSKLRPVKYRYFIRRLHRYPVGFMVQSLLRTGIRRIRGE
jgi:poly-gamma-glutamate synthesis protein (capsule biosynthesis protein)